MLILFVDNSCCSNNVVTWQVCICHHVCVETIVNKVSQVCSTGNKVCLFTGNYPEFSAPKQWGPIQQNGWKLAVFMSWTDLCGYCNQYWWGMQIYDIQLIYINSFVKCTLLLWKDHDFYKEIIFHCKYWYSAKHNSMVLGNFCTIWRHFDIVLQCSTTIDWWREIDGILLVYTTHLMKCSRMRMDMKTV